MSRIINNYRDTGDLHRGPEAEQGEAADLARRLERAEQDGPDLDALRERYELLMRHPDLDAGEGQE